MSTVRFSADSKMADLLMANGRLIYQLPRFGIEFGFGEKTVAQVCEEHGVSVPLFLTVCNIYTIDDYVPNHFELRQIPAEGLLSFLENSHRDFLKICLPQMIERILALAKFHATSDHKAMLLSFCESYERGITAHIQYEEDFIFSYIRKRLAGEEVSHGIVSEFDNVHKSVHNALRDLRNILVKYAPKICPVSQIFTVFIDIFLVEYDLGKHMWLEDTVLTPLIEHLTEDTRSSSDGAELSERERQTLTALARGLSNKQIADRMAISIHTVVAHRKNIVRKTGIRTAQGLTLYAFVNGLITEKDLR
jgi:regulator of cell morphogenesis and NO signaling